MVLIIVSAGFDRNFIYTIFVFRDEAKSDSWRLK